MEKLRAIRDGHRSAVSGLINRTDELISQNDIQEHKLIAIRNTLQKKRDLLKQLDSQILEITKVECVEQEILHADQYNLNLETAISRYKDLKTQSSEPQPMVEMVDQTEGNAEPYADFIQGKMISRIVYTDICGDIMRKAKYRRKERQKRIAIVIICVEIIAIIAMIIGFAA